MQSVGGRQLAVQLIWLTCTTLFSTVLQNSSHFDPPAAGGAAGPDEVEGVAVGARSYDHICTRHQAQHARIKALLTVSAVGAAQSRRLPGLCRYPELREKVLSTTESECVRETSQHLPEG